MKRTSGLHLCCARAASSSDMKQFCARVVAKSLRPSRPDWAVMERSLPAGTRPPQNPQSREWAGRSSAAMLPLRWLLHSQRHGKNAGRMALQTFDIRHCRRPCAPTPWRSWARFCTFASAENCGFPVRQPSRRGGGLEGSCGVLGERWVPMGADRAAQQAVRGAGGAVGAWVAARLALGDERRSRAEARPNPTPCPRAYHSVLALQQAGAPPRLLHPCRHPSSPAWSPWVLQHLLLLALGALGPVSGLGEPTCSSSGHSPTSTPPCTSEDLLG